MLRNASVRRLEEVGRTCRGPLWEGLPGAKGWKEASAPSQLTFTLSVQRP